MVTQGDIILDQPLAQIGGKGLFLKELERALLDGILALQLHAGPPMKVQFRNIRLKQAD